MGKHKILKRIDELLIECQDEDDIITGVGNNKDMVTLYDHQQSIKKWEDGLKEIKNLLWRN